MLSLESFTRMPTANKIFWLFMLFVLFLLPILSLDAGISGDEPVHYQHAEYVNKYFSSGKSDTSALYTPETNLKYYGQVFDNISFAINDLIGSEHPYKTRHFLNSLAGFLLILFSALIAIRIGGYPAGILSALFLLISPRILGHSLNNLKDIPFALGYIMSIWGLIRSMETYPKFKWHHFAGICFGFALAFGIRAGGLILIPIIFLFSFLNWINAHRAIGMKQIKSWYSGSILTGLLILCLGLGYFLGILFWPYALLDPIHNPFESLRMMTNYEVSIRTVFDGEWIWSEKLPWYYGIKWIIISNPVVILAGFVIQFFFSRKVSWPILSLLIFAAIFPILWTIIRDSNLYGAWRHLLFIYPIICILSASAWVFLSDLWNKKIVRFSVVAIVLFGSLGPIWHIVKNHPAEYVYFNRLFAGKNQGLGNYETDYYYHGVAPAMKWLDKKITASNIDHLPVIASNFLIQEYAPQLEMEFKSIYVNYYHRGKEDWDYGVFSSTYIDPHQLKNGNWPPDNTIYEVLVNKVPVCIVIERKSKDDLAALEAYRKSKFQRADSLYSEVLKVLPGHETALLYKAWTNSHLKEYEASNSLLRDLLSIHPLSDNGSDLLARNAIQQGNPEAAIETLKKVLEQNYKYLPAYEQISIAYDSLGMQDKVARYLELGYNLGLRDSVSVSRLVEALETLGSKEKAQKFRTILNKL